MYDRYYFKQFHVIEQLFTVIKNNRRYEKRNYSYVNLDKKMVLQKRIFD